jgi:cytochrome c oxidase subunit I+III
VASLIAYVGLHVALLALCAAYLGARVWRGLVTPRQRATFDNVALLWWCGCVQGVVVALLPHVVAGAMG